MIDREREDVRDALLSGMELSAELRERFEKQTKILLDRRMTRTRIIGRVLAAVIFLAASAFFGRGLYFAATANDKGLPTAARLFMCCSFAACCVFFLLGALYCIREIRSGLIAPRRLQHAGVFGSYSLVLLIATAVMVCGQKLVPTQSDAIWMTFTVLAFLVVATFSVLLHTARWHREDFLLEQKRTQLEVAMLREELTRKAPNVR